MILAVCRFAAQNMQTTALVSSAYFSIHSCIKATGATCFNCSALHQKLFSSPSLCFSRALALSRSSPFPPPVLFLPSLFMKTSLQVPPCLNLISFFSCVFLPVNNPESRLSLFPSLSICQSAPPLNWKPLRPTSTPSIRAPQLRLRLLFLPRLPSSFWVLNTHPAKRHCESLNLKLGIRGSHQDQGFKNFWVFLAPRKISAPREKCRSWTAVEGTIWVQTMKWFPSKTKASRRKRFRRTLQQKGI